MRLRSALQSQCKIAAARGATTTLQSLPAGRAQLFVAARHSGHGIQWLEATFGEAWQCRHAQVFTSSADQCRTSGQCQFLVGASRRSAAPGSRSVGAAEYGSSVFLLDREARAIGSRRSRPYRLALSGAGHRARPNPSIERTSYSWLRQLQAASHVKR
jgi:hypothetical protein